MFQGGTSAVLASPCWVSTFKKAAAAAEQQHTVAGGFAPHRRTVKTGCTAIIERAMRLENLCATHACHMARGCAPNDITSIEHTSRGHDAVHRG
jgi:hypothetical protein